MADLHTQLLEQGSNKVILAFFFSPPHPFSIVSAKEALEKCQSLVCNFKKLRALLILTSEFRDSSQFLQNEAWAFFFFFFKVVIWDCAAVASKKSRLNDFNPLLLYFAPITVLLEVAHDFQ